MKLQDPTARDAARLRELQRLAVLDSGPDKLCDDLARAAATLAGAPIALVSLVDAERQWFKARVGLAATQTSREHAFCDHALRSPDSVLVVADARDDPRFRDNPLVTGDPHIRFYAGAPLVTANGLAIGTLCVIDREPRTLEPRVLQELQWLSRQVMAALEARAPAPLAEPAQAALRTASPSSPSAPQG